MHDSEYYEEKDRDFRNKITALVVALASGLLLLAYLISQVAEYS